ncbi:MAG: SMI1/KNR4 family protein [Pirellulales bacterium]|nr:SMI1/KNR4 family protein [Pirellulales bacterium]
MNSIYAVVRQQLIEAGVATPESFVGCTLEEINSIESHFSVRLPKAYRDFLLEMGRDAGDFLVGMDYTFPLMLGFRDSAEDWLRESGSVFKLPTNAYVFFSDPGGAFSFFYCDGEQDPPVTVFIETELEPRRLFEHFSDWVRGVAEDQIAIRREREKFKKRTDP